MSDNGHPEWEREQRGAGNWTSMFGNGRGRTPDAKAPSEFDVAASALGGAEAEETLEPDLAEYRPWVLQRGSGRSPMMLHLRRYDQRSGLWLGWQLSYPHLIATDYVGDRMINLDFGGARQFVIQGDGLSQVMRHFQTGSVLLLQEYAPALWGPPNGAPIITAIQKI